MPSEEPTHAVGAQVGAHDQRGEMTTEKTVRDTEVDRDDGAAGGSPADREEGPATSDKDDAVVERGYSKLP